MTTRTESTPQRLDNENRTPTTQDLLDQLELVMDEATMPGDDAPFSTAEYEGIYQRLSSHAALVEALEEALGDWAIMNWDATPQRERIYRKLQSALAAAKGKP